MTELDKSISHAPNRPMVLSFEERKQAIANVLRYFPKDMHQELIPEFEGELNTYGHIYCYRLMPKHHLKAEPLACYETNCQQAAAIMLMIHNNLDPKVAQFPQELVTYGGNGSVFSNWAQYRLTMKYLAEMTEEQTLVMYSGHPMGLFPSNPDLPRMIITNGMVIPNYSSKTMYEKMYAQCVSQYGQMTAGSYCYIGPQGIVHGTMITILNAARKYLGADDLAGIVYVSSGLGGMSGAQPKAAKICGCISVTAECDESALQKRYSQGWIDVIVTETEKCIEMVREAKRGKKCVSIGYHGNVVDLWEAFASQEDQLVELGSDQTSLHNPYMGGYYPAGQSFEESREMMRDRPDEFKQKVRETLKRHVQAINKLTGRGMKFWDYGNAFLLEAGRAGANIWENGVYRYPSYVQDIMGDVFSLGFGPFRWVCTSGKSEDLAVTDNIAAKVFEELMETCNPVAKQQYADNLKWIREADENKLVVGSQARILYSNCEGRARLAHEFNAAVSKGLIGPVVISRDHHDVSGTDSPFRETSNITDGSQFTADMAIQNVIGDAMRGATWVAIHNGGGVGWGEVINGGFGLLLDGSIGAQNRSRSMLNWDVTNGIARRSWCGNDNALVTIADEMKRQQGLTITIPEVVDRELLDRMVKERKKRYKLILNNCTVATMVDGYGLRSNTCIGVDYRGVITHLGASLSPDEADSYEDLKGKLVTPALIDCHTHIVYQGNRSSEWEMGLKGATYQEISESGGGIVGTVNATREASVETMVQTAIPRVKQLMSEGVATIEIKSGYGMDVETEERQLMAGREIGKRLGIDAMLTYLGAHTVMGDPDEYIKTVVIPMMERLKSKGLIDAVDVFCENIAYTVEQTKKIFDHAGKLGIRVKLHGDQLTDNNCGSLAADYNALSCDHCEHTNTKGIEMMGEKGIVAVLLPVSNMFINETKKPLIEEFRKRNVAMAVATNCNPGSSPCQSIQMAMNQACIRFGMTPEEAFMGVTVNAAKALGRDDIGTIEVGKLARLVSWDCNHPTDVVYNIGRNCPMHIKI